MSKSVIIITHSNDNDSINKISDRISENGLIPIRLNTDKYPTEFKLQAELKSGIYQHRVITPNGTAVNECDIHSIWYRRLQIGKDIDPNMEKQMRSACVEETKRCLLGLLTCSESLKVDDYWSVKKASNKDFQLKLAANIGLDLPATLVTNDENRVRKFFEEQNEKIITKMQTSFSVWEEGIEKVVFTSEVNEEHLSDLDGLSQCPMVFQENIEKKLELRATVVGNKVFCAAIDSNAHEHMGTDWRKRGLDTLKDWFKYELPKDVEQKLLQLSTKLGLNYGAADIILTPDNRYKFLEINPCGEFYWMDHYTELGICDAIANLLVS